MYADDHQIYHIGSDQSSVSSKLKDATKWYDSNLLAANLNKYQTMNIQYSQAINSVASALRVNNEEIKNVENIRLLGVTIDSKFTFTDHISTICKEASQRIGVFMRLRNLIPTKAKLMRFKSAVLLYLTYCHLVWNFCRCSDGLKLERLQERGLRAVYRDKHASYQQLLERAELPTLLNADRIFASLCTKWSTIYVQLISVIFSIIITLLILYDIRISLFLDIIL